MPNNVVQLHQANIPMETIPPRFPVSSNVWKDFTIKLDKDHNHSETVIYFDCHSSLSYYATEDLKVAASSTKNENERAVIADYLKG